MTEMITVTLRRRLTKLQDQNRVSDALVKRLQTDKDNRDSQLQKLVERHNFFDTRGLIELSGY